MPLPCGLRFLERLQQRSGLSEVMRCVIPRILVPHVYHMSCADLKFFYQCDVGSFLVFKPISRYQCDDSSNPHERAQFYKRVT